MSWIVNTFLGYITLSLLWSIVVIVAYVVFERRHGDASGDGALAYGALALLPWVWPYIAVRNFSVKR